ncbi:MAG: hypothetical protein J07HX5_02045 [halophilic archaeon J07HX5]|nr:MAG: hypothetical protein J07HX5_02045 [halophilic archaeon J07HX5]
MAGTVGGHAVTVVDVPGTLGGSEAWYNQVTTGTVAALDRATVLVGVGETALEGLPVEKKRPRRQQWRSPPKPGR